MARGNKRDYERSQKTSCNQHMHFSYQFIIVEVCEHHNRVAPLLPNHSPEIVSCVLQWPLCGYVDLAIVVSLTNSEYDGYIYIYIYIDR